MANSRKWVIGVMLVPVFLTGMHKPVSVKQLKNEDKSQYKTIRKAIFSIDPQFQAQFEHSYGKRIKRRAIKQLLQHHRCYLKKQHNCSTLETTLWAVVEVSRGGYAEYPISGNLAKIVNHELPLLI